MCIRDSGRKRGLEQLNTGEGYIKFIGELEKYRKIPFLDVGLLVTREDGHIDTSVLRKPTHTGQYIHRHSNQPP